MVEESHKLWRKRSALAPPEALVHRPQTPNLRSPDQEQERLLMSF